jgi:DNA-binding beta-propeller fold protein YncE
VSPLGALLLFCAWLLLVPNSALGEEFKETFGSAEQPSFTQPEGLAVDQASGDLLVIDAAAGTLSRYNPDGTPAEFSALGSNKIEGLSFGGSGEVQVAVDNSGGATDGDIYVPQESEAAVDIFGENGSLLGQLTKYEEEGEEKPFIAPCGVAVDPSGNVYVGDFANKVHKYEPSANPPVNGDSSANFEFSSPCTLAAGAGHTAGFIFPAHFHGSVAKLDSSSGEQKPGVASGPITTVTINPATGFLYTAVHNSDEVRKYDASGAGEMTLLSSFSPPSEATGIAVDGATGNVYVARKESAKIEVWEPGVEAVSEAANPVGLTSATLNGSVNPSGVPLTKCFFEWGETESYGEIASCEEPDAEKVGEGNAFVPVHAETPSLQPGTTYHFRLVVENENNVVAEGGDEQFQTIGPAIKEEAASQVSATTARISGLINPNDQETSFVFEYVAEAQFSESEYEEAISVPASPEGVGSGTAFVPVSRQLTGLTPGTTYHFRIVATNSEGTNEGEDKKFSTLVQVPPVLPDGRAYEMVTPPQKIGEPFPPEPTEYLGGSCHEPDGCLPGVIAVLAPMQSAPDGEAVAYAGQPFSAGLASGTNEYLGKRTAGGWETKGLSSPLFESNELEGFKALSTDLSRGVLYQIQPALTPEAPTREGKSFANLYYWQEGALRPLVTEEPPQRDPGFQSSNRFRIFYSGANAGAPLHSAFSHILFAANDALTGETPFAPPAPGVEASFCEVGESCNLYEWDEGQLRLVNVLPGSELTAPDAVIGSRASNIEPPDVDHAISNDGSRIFWSDGSGQLYVRINGEETKKIEDPGRFLTASPDGSKVLLGDGCLYSVEEEECEADLTEDEGGFEGILGASEDLSRVYFIDTKILTEEENANEEKAGEGEFNLYAWHQGTTSFIGTLLEADDNVKPAPPPGYGDWKASPSVRTAQVSADGRFLAFMSKARLTGYDNAVSGGGECRPKEAAACYEVFEYDATSAKLACPSCNPSGQRPLGGANLSLFRGEGGPIAPLPPPHDLTTDGQGRLFFESMDTLAPADSNGRVQDVYEWEPDGVGGPQGCHRSTGCVFLISSGHSPNDSMFLGSTPSGDDAFFLTGQQLLPRDKDGKLDLYDARVGGGFPEGETPPCDGEGCPGPITSPPPQPSAGSSEISGSGNAKPKPPKHKKHHKKKKHHKRGGTK